MNLITGRRRRSDFYQSGYRAHCFYKILAQGRQSENNRRLEEFIKSTRSESMGGSNAASAGLLYPVSVRFDQPCVIVLL